MHAFLRTLRPLGGLALLTTIACFDEPTQPTPVRPPDTLAPARTLTSREPAKFGDLSDDSLWTLIVQADSIVDVGLKAPGHAYGMDRGRVLVSAAQRTAFRRSLEGHPGVRVLDADTLLPIARLKLSAPTTTRSLRALPFVSYVEPGSIAGSTPTPWADAFLGCMVGPYDGPGGSTWASSGDIIPWNFIAMEIDQAWRKSNGSGALVGLVDTGIDGRNVELSMPGFAVGAPGRVITREATDDSWGFDQCGHGTRMAGVIAAPRDGRGVMGVAWGANLLSVRVDDDVFLTNVAATRLGIRRASDLGARVISLALGTEAYYSSIADEIAWHYYNRDRLFFAAAGTSGCGPGLHSVVFPGSLETVTTVAALDQSGAIACQSHYGPAVDFAAYASQPTTGWADMNGPAGIKGSSNATGVLSGIAALMLSIRPQLTRTQILADLMVSASPTGLRRTDIGWGAPSALCAVRAMCTAWVDGPSLVETTGRYTFTARQLNSSGPFRYQWSTGETTPTIHQQIDIMWGTQPHILPLTVTITDLSDGTQKTVTKSVMVRQPFNDCPTCF